MPGLLTQTEFINLTIGLPWVRWRSDFEACDCYGCIVLYHRAVIGIDLGDVPQTDIAQGFAAIAGWAECGQESGATCFMAWRNGAPTHCGILIPGDRVLHSEGGPDHPGSVRITRLAAIRRIYGDLKFYKYAPC